MVIESLMSSTTFMANSKFAPIFSLSSSLYIVFYKKCSLTTDISINELIKWKYIQNK